MATYFHGAAEIQPDGLQTLYLMNPSYVGYSADVAPGPTSMVFLNTAANPIGSAGSLQSQAQQNQQQQHYVGIPLQQPQVAAAAAPDVLSAGLLPRAQYNLWNQNPASNSADLSSQLGLRRPAGPMSASQQQQQGLSLSLSPQHASCYSIGYRTESSQLPVVTQAPVISPIGGGEEVRFSGGSPSTASGASTGLQGVLLGSKYLKVAQQLLDEVVHVGKGTKEESPKEKGKGQVKVNNEGEDGNSNDGETSSSKKAAELSTTERQELQMKKAKLVNMLDEVEQRYRQYHHQMQIVISTFETVAGPGSARTYTALALQTISKQFRCLRDAITGQIRAASRSLGEEDCLLGVSKSEGGGGGGGSMLRFVDHHLRQQRALQQLGMMPQHNAWRPQRGLPERSVSILRAWLFEHFLHPYPKDSDKHMLAKQTGLTRNQVSNWFINARVRLWKPMVEEMYMEETKKNQLNNAEDDKASKSCEANEEDSAASKSSAPPMISSPRTGTEQSLANPQPLQLQGVHLTRPQQSTRVGRGYEDDDDIPNLKRARSSSGNNTAAESLSQNQMLLHSMPLIPMSMELKPEEASGNTDFFLKFAGNGSRLQPVEDIHSGGYSSFLSAASASNGANGFGGYSLGEMGQFAPSYSGNGVSLTLGLPHCETLSLSGAQPSFLSADGINSLGRRLEMSTTDANDDDYCGTLNNNSSNSAQVPHHPTPNNLYDNLSIQSRKRFTAQLLPDFVA